MSTLNDITIQLIHIKQAIVEHPVFTRGSGVPVDDPAYAREAEELERMSERLNILIRNVRNHLHLQSAKEQGLWNVPRDLRYGAATAVGQQQAEAQRLLQAALDLRRLLDALMRRNGLVSEGEIAEKVGEFIKEWHEKWHSSPHATHAGAPGVPSYVPPLSPGHFQASPEAATIAVYAALKALAYFLKRKKGQAA